MSTGRNGYDRFNPTFLVTINLLDAIQLPQLINRPLTVPVDVFSISASSHTMKGSLPPNSKTVFFI